MIYNLLLELKDREDAERAAKGVKKDIKKVEQKGLMAKPKEEETAIMSAFRGILTGYLNAKIANTEANDD